MILGIHSKQKTDDPAIFAAALAFYFDEIRVNDDTGAPDYDLDIMETHIRISQSGTVLTELSAPYRIGQILNTIQNSIQNNKIKQQSSPIAIGDNVLNPDTKILHRATKKIRLTDKEFDIIYALFISSPGKIARDVLLHQIWGYGDMIETHTLETHIYRLRQKIEIDATQPDFLKTDDDGYYLNF